MKISSYITARCPLLMGYPIEASIRSLFAVSDQIVVNDTSDQEDGTTALLNNLAAEFNGEFLVVRNPNCDYTKPNFGIYDGQNKTYAREHCTGDICLQIDADEILEDGPLTRKKIEKLAANLDKENPIISTLVVEYWGSSGKVRCDINPWKERLSLNDPNIIHGIPSGYRKFVNGLLYSQLGSDGCNMIYKDSGNPIPCLNFITPVMDEIRKKSAFNKEHVPTYEAWYNKMGEKLPVIYHLSWYSVYQKMLKYKLFWNDSWMSLYNEQRPIGYNPFFSKPFSEVSEEEMRETARKIEEETGGHIFHSPYISGLSPKTNSIKFNKPIPESTRAWTEKNRI